LLSSVPSVTIPSVTIPSVAIPSACRFLNLLISLIIAIYGDSFLTLDRDSNLSNLLLLLLLIDIIDDRSLTSNNGFFTNQGIRTSFLSPKDVYLSGNIGMSGGFGLTCRETGGSTELIS
ncbi:hypothetical protein L209DRAFT_759385, partial [Thermothelomyces heterothallicus CBS 203.75]